MPKTICIAGHEFRTKRAAKEFIAALRDRYADGVTIPDPDSIFLDELLAAHPEAFDKTGCGISHFTVATETVFGRTRHFVVHRTDGSCTDFSFHSCLDGPKDRRDRLDAMRRALEPSILRFRGSIFLGGPVSCPFTGVALSPRSCHIDHTPPNTFRSLVGRWLSLSGLSLDEIGITPPLDNQTVTLMADEGQRQSWIDFHDRHASLRALAPRANLSDAKKEERAIKG
jgi:hypothetical protein